MRPGIMDAGMTGERPIFRARIVRFANSYGFITGRHSRYASMKACACGAQSALPYPRSFPSPLLSMLVFGKSIRLIEIEDFVWFVTELIKVLIVSVKEAILGVADTVLHHRPSDPKLVKFFML